MRTEIAGATAVATPVGGAGVVDPALSDKLPVPTEAMIPGGRQRRAEPITNRVRRDGKFFRLGTEKFYVKGVTYGSFAPNSEGEPLPERDRVRSDFAQMIDLGANCVRIYHNPPAWFMDLAQEMGLKIFLDVSWPKNQEFINDRAVREQAYEAVRVAARTCGNHPALFAISVVNEIPPDLVRFSGHEHIEQLVDELVAVAKSEAPECLVTFANFPTTEFLNPRAVDFVCFNVYLNDALVLRNYLARLQSIAGDRPIMLGEYGIDTMQQFSEEEQADLLEKHVRAAFDEGLVGTFIFSFTDDWYVHGWQIDLWGFGLVKTDRTPKLAFNRVKEIFKRAPHTADDKLPSASIVICSYNGASTVESCLRSMEKLRYPGEYEVVFVDDGSKDNTQQILRKFPWVRNIRQKNMGLSYARNVGAKAAKGDVIVYTDSDCEADEDWLYYLMLALARSNHVGMGGPNLIPDEGSWVADCVGLSPGGPTHVMIDDREAEHVPGCNMAFYKWAFTQVNGFDSQFRSAGDDVDFIWRLQGLNYSIGFSPAAQVWHYRRNSVSAYLKQQRGYGIAEAMLKYKHPDHFNTLGASHWRGKIYGGDASMGVRIGGDVIYHGLFGTGLFQTIYRRPASMALLMMMSIEWHLLAAFVTVLGIALPTLFWVALLMFMVPLILASIAAYQAPRPRHAHPFSKPLVAYLHLRQPITRGWARYTVRLKAKDTKPEAKGHRRPAPLPFDRDGQTLRYWSKHQGRISLLDKVTEAVRGAGWRVRVDSGWKPWDMEIYGSRYTKVRLTSATELHHGDENSKGKLTRIRVEPVMSNFTKVLLAASMVFAALLLVKLWPFSRPAVLIPLALWTTYLVNRWRVTAPIVGLIDEVAENFGFYPVPAKKPEKPKRTATAAARQTTDSSAAANEVEADSASIA